MLDENIFCLRFPSNISFNISFNNFILITTMAEKHHTCTEYIVLFDVLIYENTSFWKHILWKHFLSFNNLLVFLFHLHSIFLNPFEVILFTIRARYLCFVSIRHYVLLCMFERYWFVFWLFYIINSNDEIFEYFDEIFAEGSFLGRYVPNMFDCRRKRMQLCFSA